MTVATPDPAGSAVAPYEEDYSNIGLEDVEASDLRIPRINIDHDNHVFVDSLSKEEFPSFTGIFLGLVKQRIMWPPKLEDDSRPQCKSPDNVHGFPNMDPQSPQKFQFPWAASNFDPSQARPVELAPDEKYPEGWSSNGHNVLSCEACVFSQWGKDSDGKSTPPPCNEQHSYPVLRAVDLGNGEWTYVLSIFTVARSAISNSRSFINSFAQSRQSMFTMMTAMTLRVATRGRNEYCVPEFRRLNTHPTDRTMWPEYAQQFRTVRSFLRSAPRVKDDGAPTEVDNTNTAPAQVVEEPPAQQPPAPAPAPAPAAPEPQAQAPAPPPAAPAPPVAPPAPPAAPAAPPPAAAASPAPPAAPPAAPPPAAQAPASEGEDDLPF